MKFSVILPITALLSISLTAIAVTRRWELTANHWDLPIHVVILDASS